MQNCAPPKRMFWQTERVRRCILIERAFSVVVIGEVHRRSSEAAFTTPEGEREGSDKSRDLRLPQKRSASSGKGLHGVSKRGTSHVCFAIAGILLILLCHSFEANVKVRAQEAHSKTSSVSTQSSPQFPNCLALHRSIRSALLYPVCEISQRLKLDLVHQSVCRCSPVLYILLSILES